MILQQQLQYTAHKQLTVNNIQINPIDRQMTLKEFNKNTELEDNPEGSPEIPEHLITSLIFNGIIFTSTEQDPHAVGSLRYYVEEIVPVYLVDYSLPAEMNTSSYSSRFGDLKIDLLKKTRLYLGISVAGLSAAVIAVIAGLPSPFNWVSALALSGPLFVSTYGLITQKN